VTSTEGLVRRLLDLGIIGCGDHGVDHLEVVLLHGVGVLDVVGELLSKLVVGHASHLLSGSGGTFPPYRSYPHVEYLIPAKRVPKLAFKP
jgi:hypothetical protein